MSEQKSRNIVLFSDGTGNSSVSAQKSNVWRLYQALDLNPDPRGSRQQLAFYDDGVGTQGFKPLQLLGGAFGWGLSRNVRQLYENLCRHYRPGDRIYIFGFSRGAFTARVLAHFISRCGILDRSKPVQGRAKFKMNTDRGLKKGVKRAYKSYRHYYWQTASWWLRNLSKGPRFLRNLAPWWNVIPDEEFKAAFSLSADECTRGRRQDLIEFVGVWDTVDAVGLPIDELSTVLNSVIYPYKFMDCDFSDDVARGRQALAIDDERHAFHPLLWNEANARKDGTPHDIKQVWFAGMHSNVGGSYPEDQLAHISLAWMIDEARETPDRPGLFIADDAIANIRSQATPLGKMYDSRRGVSNYYRYKPRDITALSNQKGKDWKIEVKTPKIHHSVIDRIADSTVGYAPSGVPGVFDVVGHDGHLLSLASDHRYHETSNQRQRREDILERVKSHIFWRRFAYFFLLLVTLSLLIMPHFRPATHGLKREGASYYLGWVFDRFSGILPNFSTYWTEAWVQAPACFIGGVVCLILFYFWSDWIKGNIQQVAENGWWFFKDQGSEPPDIAPGIFERGATKIRSRKESRHIYSFFKRFVLPYGFSAIIAIIVISASYRVFFHYPAVKDGVCVFLEEKDQPSGTKTTDADVNKVSSYTRQRGVFETRDFCFSTEMYFEKGQRYRISVITDSDNKPIDHDQPGEIDKINIEIGSEMTWQDLDISAGVDGFENGWKNYDPRFILFVPTRRHLSLPWFTLMGEIGKDSGHVFPINRDEPFIYTSPADGRLHLYVNDMINVPGIGVPQDERDNDGEIIESYGPDAAYRNNRGKAKVTIVRAKRDRS